MNELIDFCLDTENPEKNYKLAQWYEKQNHTLCRVIKERKFFVFIKESRVLNSMYEYFIFIKDNP